MSPPVILGIDPGARNTGLVVRRREDLLAWELVVRPTGTTMPGGAYITQVRLACNRVLNDAGLDASLRDTYVVGIEAVAYWPDHGPTRKNQTHLYGTAMVIGSLLARWPNAIVVESGRGVADYHPQSYPEPIRPASGSKGKDRLRHVRAAWDHSHAAETLWLAAHRARP